jgi:hypothetical protein
MFEISNRIAYADRMVHATVPASSAIRDVMGPSAWVHVEAPSADKWVAEEGYLVDRAIGALSQHLAAAPDIYVISPFRIPARNLQNLLGEGDDAEPGFGAGRPSLAGRVGTVHSFQGKEAESVILVLGAGRGAKPGSRKWAAGTPNLLNVAATRAKRSLYIVGNHDLWSGVGYFTEAAGLLPVVSAED